MFNEETIALINKGIDVTRLSNNAFEYADMTMSLKEKGMDITGLPEDAFWEPSKAIRLKTELESSGIDEIKLSNDFFVNIDATIELKNKGIDITKLTNCAFGDANVTIELYEFLKPKGIDITKLPNFAFMNADTTMKLYNFLKKEGIDITKLPNFAFYDVDVTIKLYEILKIKGIDITKLPDIAFREVDNTIFLHKKGIDIVGLSENAFSNVDLTISLNEEGIDITKLSDKFFKSSIKIKNIKYLLNLSGNNYDELNGYPVEFFTCPIELVDEMYKTYNSNISKSIFGIDNPKIIAALVYCNSVFRKYIKENNDANLFTEEQILNIGLACSYDTYKYQKNISNVDSNWKFNNEYNQQFGFVSMSDSESKSHILDKLRNSCVHFRFRPVFDDNGNLLEDKVYLYDKYDDSPTNNFNIIFDIKYLIDLAHNIELQLANKKVSYASSGPTR